MTWRQTFIIEVILERIKTYNLQTKPVVDLFKKTDPSIFYEIIHTFFQARGTRNKYFQNLRST